MRHGSAEWWRALPLLAVLALFLHVQVLGSAVSTEQSLHGVAQAAGLADCPGHAAASSPEDDSQSNSDCCAFGPFCCQFGPGLATPPGDFAFAAPEPVWLASVVGYDHPDPIRTA